MARTIGYEGFLAGVLPAVMCVIGASACIGSEPILADTCPSTETMCGDACVDTTSDSNHCGACGTVCPPGQYCSASACAYPTSCADLLTKAGPAMDAPYIIQPASRKPFTVYCAGMSTPAPKEYLTLSHTDAGGTAASNVSTYDKVSCHCMDDMRHYFEKVRIDPQTLVVDRMDTTFAANVTSDPTCWAAYGTGVCWLASNLRFGAAGNCIFNGTPMPGNIDLRGTAFSIDPSVSFVPNGYYPYGTSTFSSDRKTVDFTGGGDCGENGPMPMLLLKQD
jgi:hypothetical protein